MRVVAATLRRRCTIDGMVEVHDDVATGKMYKVDLDSREMVSGINLIKNVRWRREIICTVGEDEGWLPTEILDILCCEEPDSDGVICLNCGRKI